MFVSVSIHCLFLQTIKDSYMKLLKNIAVISVLVAFLLPASGVMLFMHHCSSMQTTEVSMDGSNSCCTTHSGLFRSSEQFDDSCIEHQHNCTHHTYISEQDCCVDGRIFVKIDSDYLNTFYKTLQPDFNAIEVVEKQPLTALSLSGFIFHNTTRAHDPPGLEIYLQVSSLRL